jgi:hypothetical protein
MDNIPTQVVVAIIGATPALLAPLVTSLLQRRGSAREARELETIEKRVLIIERLLALEKHLPDGRKKLLQDELADIAQDLVTKRTRDFAVADTVVERLSFLKRVFLVYQQPTLSASVYRGFFWFFFSFGILGSLSTFLVGVQSDDPDWPFAIIGALLYIVIGLLFRAAALRQRKRVPENAAVASK